MLPRRLSTQLEYPLGGSSKNDSHVHFLLQVFWVILLFDINVVLTLPWWPDVTIIQSDVTIVVPWQLSTGSKHDYRFCYCPLVGILFEVLRIIWHKYLGTNNVYLFGFTVYSHTFMGDFWKYLPSNNPKWGYSDDVWRISKNIYDLKLPRWGYSDDIMGID